MRNIDKTEFLLGLYDLLKRRRDPSEDLEWSSITQFYNDNSGETVASDYLRKSARLFYLYEDAGYINVQDGHKSVVVPQSKTTSLNADGSESSEAKFEIENEENLHDTEYLLKLHGYDPRKFELISAKNSRWTTSSDGRAPLYSSKISVKPKHIEAGKEDFEAWFSKLDRTYTKPDCKKIAGWGGGDKLLVLPISDLHFNLQATLFSSGNEYNCEIAEKIFFHIIRDVLDETEKYSFKKIIFTIGGDQMNADGIGNSTTKGTPQDCDKHYFDACEQMYAMTVRAVDILAEKAPVDVIHIPSNHDLATGFALAKYVDAWFRNDDRVTVDYSPLPRKYKLFGKTLFCFTHDADVKRLQKLIPDEARELWAQANFTEVMLQHLHKEELLSNENSIRIQRLPSPTAKSIWTNDSCYGARRQCKSFVYDAEYGLKNTIYTVVPDKI